ncbi:hypothetical protein M2408_001572 [Sphingobacterium sp. BIGb0165]|nr:hypothetical protein [Sphingobacterium sp. BIGb0165]
MSRSQNNGLLDLGNRINYHRVGVWGISMAFIAAEMVKMLIYKHFSLGLLCRENKDGPIYLSLMKLNRHKKRFSNGENKNLK